VSFQLPVLALLAAGCRALLARRLTRQAGRPGSPDELEGAVAPQFASLSSLFILLRDHVLVWLVQFPPMDALQHPTGLESARRAAIVVAHTVCWS